MTPFRERNPLPIGLTGIGLVLALLVTAFNADQLPIVGAGDVRSAEFVEAAGLSDNDEVRVAGVKVGKVVDVDLAGDRVLVKFRVKGVEVGDESRAAIKIKTVLGRKYLELTPKGDGDLGEDEPIPVTRTTAPYEITDAFRGLATTVEEIDSDRLAEAFDVLATTFRDTPDEVRASLDGLSRLSRTIASRDARLAELLERSRGVTQVLSARDDDLVVFLRQGDLLLREVRARREAIGRLLDSTTELSLQLTALVAENRAQLRPALASLREVVRVLQDNQANLDRSIALLAPFVRVFANNLGNGRWFDVFVVNLTTGDFTPGTPGPGPGGPR